MFRFPRLWLAKKSNKYSHYILSVRWLLLSVHWEDSSRRYLADKICSQESTNLRGSASQKGESKLERVQIKVRGKIRGRGN